jgi:large subunit ribosomal protein L16
MSVNKRTFKKNFLPSLKKKAKNSFIENYGNFSLKATESGYITASQLETVKRISIKFLKDHGSNQLRMGKQNIVWLRVHPTFFVTSKGSEVRIGGGKGSLKTRVVKIDSGQIILEFNLESITIARKLLKLISIRLPIKIVLNSNINLES